MVLVLYAIIVLRLLANVEFGKDGFTETGNEGLGGREIILLDDKYVAAAFHAFVCFFNADDRTEVKEVSGDGCCNFVFVFHSFLKEFHREAFDCDTLDRVLVVVVGDDRLPVDIGMVGGGESNVNELVWH